ncbi:MAG: hypothetical protein ABS84_12540 [Rubrivivax sp. SCN 71-131]|mgnify:CR=1|jgi:hypothetical protein|nr:MAG: hypothetical protein ABS84_12540 [Rubrivivax sp. SCN 71-131]
MRSLSLTPTWRRRHSTLNTPSAFRVEVRPPSLRHAPASLGQRLMFWLMAPAPHDAAPPINRLPGVKQDFRLCLEDVSIAAAESLRTAIDGARSLRELWHLRADLYGLVGRAHSENVAEQRLARLNRHFPTRAPRPGAPAHSRPVFESRTVLASLPDPR